ncbi:hypothetical protein OHT93_27900 [Streptomyces sp. NBC_00191]
MSDESPKELSPKEQHEQDLTRVQTQLGVTEATRQVVSMMDSVFGSGRGPGPFARFSFEGHELNAMIDLVENTNPADLENAGLALWKARDAIREAARELKDHIAKVEWKGEAGNEFRSFGTDLVAHAEKLGTFADVAGTQITVAGTGLASVHMPPRDDRLVKKTVADIAAPGRVEGNPDYDKAVKVEKDRQEAINQMNRLASYYAVSEQTLAAQEPPRFERALKANVPRPAGFDRSPEPSSGATATGVESSGTTAPQSPSGHADSSVTGRESRAEAIGTVAPAPDRNTSVEIDSVAAPPPPTTSPGPAPAPAVTGPTGPAGGPVPPMANGLANPVKGGAPRPTSASGVSKAGGQGTSSVGRPGAAGSRNGAAGHPSPVGRQGGVGASSPATGRAGAARPVGAAGQNPAAGRAGTAGSPAGRGGTGATGSRAGRGNGIVGGNPQRAAGGSSGSRLPRGTVVGGEGTTPGRTSTGRTSQQGVVGAKPANGASRPGGRGTASSNGVVGTPRGGAPGARPGAGGFTQGGAGLVRSTTGRNQRENEEQERTGSARPDYLTEDEETWAARQRGAVPPVIE